MEEDRSTGSRNPIGSMKSPEGVPVGSPPGDAPRPDTPLPDCPVREVAVLGAGMWGAVIAGLLHSKGLSVRVWDIEPRAVEHLRTHRHPRAFAEWRLDDAVLVTDSIGEALGGTELAVVVSASGDIHRVGAAAAALARQANDPSSGWVVCSKGIDIETGRPLGAVLADSLAPGDAEVLRRVGVLSGPCIATEVALGIPTSVVAAAPAPALADLIQAAFMTSRFRVYTQEDLLGVELGGALKNVIALAAGVCDGLGFGANTKAALITRGLAEITRLGVKMGADSRTFFGLAGMGDLVVTSFSPHSRNRRCGEALGRGLTLDQARAEIGMAIEGVPTCEAACRLGERHAVELPICRAVRALLAGRLRPQQAVETLMRRDPKPEWY